MCYHISGGYQKEAVGVPSRRTLTRRSKPQPAEAGVTYSAWLAVAARKEFRLRAGLEAVAELERDHGPFDPEETAEAEQWARTVLDRSRRNGPRRRRSA